MKASDYLTSNHFMMMMVLAGTLHALFMMVWNMMPHDEVASIPVRTLNIKLGDGEEFAIEDPKPLRTAAPVQSAPTPAASDMVQELLDKSLEAKPEPAPPPSAPVEVSEVAQPATQYVRSSKGKRGAAGSPLGNSTEADAEVISKYEQTISLWIQQRKIYPDEARAERLQGEAVVRIRIDRTGNILFYALDKRTGYEVLDAALVEMIRAANPVPPVPQGYPGHLIEFLVPVSFRLE